MATETGLLFSIAEKFPDLGIRSRACGKYCLVLGIDEGKFIGFSTVASLALGLCAGIAFISGGLANGIAAFALVFSICFFIFLNVPENEMKKREMRMEAGIPAFLRTVGMLLGMNVPFIQALRIASREKDSEIALAFSGALEEVEEGGSLAKALSIMAKNSMSPSLKKTIAQVISAYSHGGGAEGMMRIADDMVSLQKYRARDFASKSALFGLVFVVCATVIPTFFLVISAAGKFALGIDVGKEVFMAVFLLVFPIVDLAILAFSRSQMPPGPFSGQHGNNENKLNPAFLLFGFAAVAALAAAFAPGAALGIAVATVAGVAGFLVFREKYNGEKRLEKIEAELPDSLLSASGLPKSRGLEFIFARMAEAENSFSVEARKTEKQLAAGLGSEKALSDLWERNNSMVLKRVSSLILNANLAGASVAEKMHEIAEDLMLFSELRRERENALSMQKYTLFLGALVVPVILSVSLGLSSQISSFIGEGNAGVVQAAPGTISGYIILYSAVSAYYISSCEERKSRMFPYFFLMAALGLAAFYIVSFQFKP